MLHRNLFSLDSFSGSIVVEGKSMYVSTPVSANFNMRVKGIQAKLRNKPIEAVGTLPESGVVVTTGQVLFSREFDMIWGYSKAMREQYKDSNITFSGSFDNQQSASEIMKKLDLK